MIAVGHQVFTVVSTYLAEEVGWTATNEMRAELADHVLHLDMGFHKEHTPGELIERIDGDVTTLSNFFSAFVIQVVGNLVLLIGILVLLWRENVWVGVGLTVFSLAALAIMLRLQVVTVPWWKQVRATQRQSCSGSSASSSAAPRTSAPTAARAYMIHRFTAILRDWLPQQVRARMGFAVLWATGIVTYIVGTGLVFWLGSVLLGNGALTIGSVYLIFHYTEMMRQPMDQIRSQMEDLQKAGAGISRVEELFAPFVGARRRRSLHLPSGPLSVAFEQVEFAYDDAAGDERVLHGVSFGLAAGRVLGVLGRTGTARPHSPGCSPGSTTRSPAPSCSGASTQPTSPPRSCAAASAWSPRTCSCFAPRYATT